MFYDVFKHGGAFISVASEFRWFIKSLTFILSNEIEGAFMNCATFDKQIFKTHGPTRDSFLKLS